MRALEPAQSMMHIDWLSASIRKVRATGSIPKGLPAPGVFLLHGLAQCVVDVFSVVEQWEENETIRFNGSQKVRDSGTVSWATSVAWVGPVQFAADVKSMLHLADPKTRPAHKINITD